jgi:2-oxoisovalerate dehydrogenase E1 component
VKTEGRDEIVYASSGESATSEGEFFEAINWASRERLPVLFVVQNTGSTVSVPQSAKARAELTDIAEGFGIRTYRFDGTRFTQMYLTLQPIVEDLRKGKGPVLVEGLVERLDPHSSSDDHKKYRSEEELDRVRKRDPLAHTEAELVKRGIITTEDVESHRERVKSEVDRAAEEADAVGPPDPSTILQHIYSGGVPVTRERDPASSGEPVTMVDAVGHALREEMERDPKIFMWGEDVADPKGGVFGATRGLGTTFPGRVENAPLAEASIVGVAQGMAIAGWKPVIEIQFSDDSFPAFMQLRNEVPTLRWRSNNAWSCPMVVRMTVGGYIHGGPYHSQTVESLYAQTPGWRILYPSNAADAKGLLKSACRCDDPVLFLEHKGLYRQVYSKSPEPDADYLIPFGKARRVREGEDLTVVTWGSQVHRSVQAAQELAKDDVSVEVLDLRSIVPYDKEGILRSVRKTGRAVVLHEAPLLGGFGGEVASFISEYAFESLDAPVRRLGAADCFVPFAPNLEAAVLPSLEDVLKALRDLAAY